MGKQIKLKIIRITIVVDKLKIIIIKNIRKSRSSRNNNNKEHDIINLNLDLKRRETGTKKQKQKSSTSLGFEPLSLEPMKKIITQSIIPLGHLASYYYVTQIRLYKSIKSRCNKLYNSYRSGRINK